MSAIDHTTTSSDRRPIALRLRPDLEMHPGTYQDEPGWIVKDPVAMKYFRLKEPEYEAIRMIDGNTSVAEIKEHLESRFPEFTVKVQDVHLLVNSLHKSGLLISNMPGQAAPLKVRREKELKQKAMQLLMSVMSLRLPGVDPERFLNWLYPKVSFLFSKLVFVMCLLLTASAACLVLLNLGEFYKRLPEFSQFFNVNNLLFMGAIMIVTKSIHELGHGLMCKHFGGECHEIGFMFLVLTPAMYCNTSDSWILPNKWHRIAIGAAGMYVEVVMASVCTFIWWYTQPGLLHYFALNVIFLSGVSTILFNANPLLRYDGYYMLSDYLEIPNLAEKSKTSLINRLRVSCLGMKPIKTRMLPQRKQLSFATYAVASFVYRWFVMIMIFWFLSKVFQPYGLEIIGHALIVMSLVGMLVIPMFKLVKFFWYPGRLREVKMSRFSVSAIWVGLVLCGLFLIPVSRHVSASFVVQPVDADMIYVIQPGQLSEVLVASGDEVNTGDVIAKLANPDLEIELERLRGAMAREQADLAAHRLSQGRVSDAARRIAESTIRVADFRNRIAIQEQQIEKLNLVANRNGVIIPPPNIPAQPNAGETMQGWSGTPLDPENRSVFMQSQTLFCLVGDPTKMKATLVIDQSDAKLIEKEQPVKLMFDELPGERFKSFVQYVSRDPLSSLPRELSLTNGGSISARPLPGGGEAPMLTSYEVSVPLDEIDDAILTGFRGQAKIQVGELPLGQQFIHYLRTVINFR